MIEEIAECGGTETRKARKAHKCCECSGLIQPGEIYIYHHGIWSDGPAAYKVCRECEAIRVEIDANTADWSEGTAYTMLCESVFESGDGEWIARYVANRERRGGNVPEWMRRRVSRIDHTHGHLEPH